ncbi:tetratricopeptide repeat protein [Adhaeribacter sp. BT258]|uniref:Tetratricopeptide repeat protein n=1 Tax=Adhaeribacter terrigena TaxID=2793070 RepID=A0ABS1BZL8_9BACT|nr:tetratricopeptide repeat protein [Adhaeribacter terrigena]MBK0402612.1 tetratricopeptide repeat protein [Adhaeribacter terrigena]
MEAINQDRALLLIQQRKFNLAEAELRNALSQDLDNAQNHAFLALCLMNQQKTREALQEVDLAIALEPDFAFPHYIQSLIFYNEDKLDACETAIKEAIRLDSYDATFYDILGSVFFKQKNFREAMRIAEEGLTIDPENVDCLNLKARALNLLGDKKLAADSYKNAFYHEPENDLTHANQGWSYIETGEYKKALEHFQEALRLNPNSDFAREGLVEALKAKYWIYRAVLNLNYKMLSLGSGARWGMMIGVILFVRVMPILIPFYLVLIFFTWFSDLIFNTLLRFNTYGRQALSAEQIKGSNIFLAFLTGGATALTAGNFLAIESFEVLGIVLIGLLFPVAGTLSMENKTARKKSFYATLVLAAAGIAFLGTVVFSPEDGPAVMKLFYGGIIGYTWLRQSLN